LHHFKLENCAGCTANVALIYKDTLYVANAGDSRSVLCRDKKPLDMSHDHKPDDPLEKQRIEKAGGTVANGRIDSRKIVTFILFQSEFKSIKSFRRFRL
jgi:serine/threonine protein phosphatase PrpC